MMKIFEFLYYCLYRIFALVKRVGEKDENLASSFYAVLLSTNVLSLLLLSKLIIPLNLINQYLLKGSFFIIFFIWYFVCKHYFLKKENYFRIISHYEEMFPGKKKQMALIGIAYFLLTPLTFIVLATWLSRM
jgi:hypothetical protein